MYALLVGSIERSVLAERQIAVALLAAGGKDVEVPTMAGALEEFDAALVAEPVTPDALDREQAELRAALGVL